MKAYYVHYRTATGEHACIIPATDAFNAVSSLMRSLGLQFADLKSIKSCRLGLA